MLPEALGEIVGRTFTDKILKKTDFFNPGSNSDRYFWLQNRQDTPPVLVNHRAAVGQRDGQRDLNSHRLNSHPSGTRRTGLTYNRPKGQTPTRYADAVVLTDGRMCRWISSQTVTVIGNNFLLCQGIYMQINVSSVHLLIPAINHYRLAHQFLAIIRSYRQGCNIILKYCVTALHRTAGFHGTPAPPLLLSATLLLLLFGVRSGGDKRIKCPCVQCLLERFPVPY